MCASWLPWKGNGIHTCLECSWENYLTAPLTFPSSQINQSSNLWSWDCSCHTTTMRSWTNVHSGAWHFLWKNSLSSQLKVVQSSNWLIDAGIKHSCAQSFSNSWDNSSLEIRLIPAGTPTTQRNRLLPCSTMTLVLAHQSHWVEYHTSHDISAFIPHWSIIAFYG